MKFRKKPDEIEATQWQKLGDRVGVLQYPQSPIIQDCAVCGVDLNSHGWIKSGASGGWTVHPGDWIVISGSSGLYPMRPEDFEKAYEKVES